MIKTIVNLVKDEAEHIENVKFFRYDGVDYLNHQSNNSTVQVWFEDDIYIDYLVTKDLNKLTFNVDILDKKAQDETIIDKHNDTTKIAVVLLKLLEKHYDMLNIYDYSIMTLSHYTDDDLFGVRLTVSLFAPSLINYCNIEDYIDEENKYKERKDMDIDINIPTIDINDLDIKPKTLTKNNKKNK